MIDTIEFQVKDSRIKVRQPKRRIFIPFKRADVFGDKRRKRTRTRQAQIAHIIKESYD